MKTLVGYLLSTVVICVVVAGAVAAANTGWAIVYAVGLLLAVFGMDTLSRYRARASYWRTHRRNRPYVRELGPYRAEEKDAA